MWWLNEKCYALELSHFLISIKIGFLFLSFLFSHHFFRSSCYYFRHKSNKRRKSKTKHKSNKRRKAQTKSTSQSFIMCNLTVSLLSAPLFFIPFTSPLFVLINLFVRLLTLGILIILCPCILIPPCTCIYPLLAAFLLLRNGEIPEDTDGEGSLVSLLFNVFDSEFMGNATDFSVYIPGNWTLKRIQQSFRKGYLSLCHVILFRKGDRSRFIQCRMQSKRKVMNINAKQTLYSI